LGHKTVYPVDVDGEFPFQRIVDYAKASARSKELDALMNEIGDMVKAQNQYLVSHTVPETLLYMNANDKVAEDVGFYYRQAHFGEPGDWPVPTSSPFGSGETCESTAISRSSSNRPMSASW
jgi:Family of unknown function (DUF5694)